MILDSGLLFMSHPAFDRVTHLVMHRIFNTDFSTLVPLLISCLLQRFQLMI